MSAGDDILILLAAGSARRMQSVVDDKTTALLAGRPVFIDSLQLFLSTGLIGRVVITYRDEAQLAKLQGPARRPPAVRDGGGLRARR
jgi:2-C-methyl-D-erythritol 4-phosphate cytidylyltransferase